MAKANFTILHNPRCGKSREALKILQENGIEPEVVEYLKETPSEEELKKILMKLHLKPMDIIRKGEPIFKEKLRGLNLNDEEWIKVMVENPILIERPIVIKGNKAVVARPPENVEELF